MLDRRDFLLAAAATSAPSVAMAQRAPGTPAPPPALAPRVLPPVPTRAPAPEGPLVTPAFASLASDTKFESLSPATVEATRWFLLDTIGCGLAGHALPKAIGPIALAKMQGGAGARVLGSGERANPAAAGFANGELMNALDYDALPHSAAYVVAPALAYAEANRLSGRDLIVATAVGIEIAGRLTRNTMTMGSTGNGTTPDVFGNSNEAIIGGAAALASLMKLDAGRAAHAIGLAAYYCAVPYCHDWEVRSPKSNVKYGPVGPSCQNAFNAAFLASQGYTGDPLALDGPAGFVMFYERHQWDANRVLARLGQDWSIERTGFKPYAACKFVHSQIEAMTALRQKSGVRPEDVTAIHSQCYPFVANYEMMNVRTAEDAQFSVPYALALTLHGIPLDAHAYDASRLNDPAIRATMHKTSWSWHPDSLKGAGGGPNGFFCQVDVTAGGRTWSETAVNPKILQPGPAMSAKFLANASVSLPAGKAQAAHDAILKLDHAGDCRALVNLLVRA